jgi:glutathione S-transferase
LAILLENTFCERIYWIIVYLRWQNDAGWNAINPIYFSHLPLLLKLFLPALIRKKTIKSLYFQGTGRHSYEEVITIGKKSIDALGSILGSNPYFLGDKPTSVDATAFSFLANIIMTPLDNPLKEHALKIPTLKEYCLKMWDEFYSDFEKPLV